MNRHDHHHQARSRAGAWDVLLAVLVTSLLGPPPVRPAIVSTAAENVHDDGKPAPPSDPEVDAIVRESMEASVAATHPELLNGGLHVGMTWDDVLARVGRYTSHEWLSDDSFQATYDIKGHQYKVEFQRPSLPELGPYRIVDVTRVQ